MSRIYGIQEIVLGDVHPERIKAIKATTRNLGHDPKQLSTHLFPENPTHARARRIRENMLERVNDALVRWQGTMIIIPSMLALEHDMFRGVDDVCTRTGQKVRLIVATCRSSGSLRNALNADPELARFVGTYFHVHMTMADECLPKELEHLRSALKAQPSHSYPTIST